MQSVLCGVCVLLRDVTLYAPLKPNSSNIRSSGQYLRLAWSNKEATVQFDSLSWQSCISSPASQPCMHWHPLMYEPKHPIFNTFRLKKPTSMANGHVHPWNVQVTQQLHWLLIDEYVKVSLSHQRSNCHESVCMSMFHVSLSCRKTSNAISK